MFAFDSGASEDSEVLPERTRAVTGDPVRGAPPYHQTICFEVKELGEIDMVSMARLAGMVRDSADQR
jgi:hypothetical protein